MRRIRTGFDLRTITVSETLQLFWPWTLLLVDSTAGSVTITLPAAQDSKGYTVQVKKLIAANTVTLDAYSAELIDGAATLAWTTQYQSYFIVCDGTGWVIL